MTAESKANAMSPRINVALDVAALAVASIVATGRAPAAVTLATFVATASVWALGGRALHRYDAWRDEHSGDFALTALLVASECVALAILEKIVAAPIEVWWFAAIALPLTAVIRVIVPSVRSLAGATPDQVLIIGTGPLGRLTAAELRRGRPAREVIGFLAFADEGLDSRLRAPVLGQVDDLERVLRERAVDEVFVAGHVLRDGPAMQAAVRACERFGVPFALPASDFRLERARPSSRAVSDGFVHFVSFERKPVQMAIKRLIDIVASTVALTVLSPLLLGVALAIKLTSRGPILYRQQRVGMHGRPFHMLKFRSMVQNAEALQAQLLAQNEVDGPVFKIRMDPRVTGVGRFIRKFSIDELPQLLNILRGEMTIVGPRPPLASEVVKYEAWQRRRLSVRPGLTCHWAIRGRNDLSFETWMYLDMQYIDHWSLAGDLALILKTVPVVLTGRGAS